MEKEKKEQVHPVDVSMKELDLSFKKFEKKNKLVYTSLFNERYPENIKIKKIA